MWISKARDLEWLKQLPDPEPKLRAWGETIVRVRDELTRVMYDRYQMRCVMEMAKAEPKLNGSGHPFLFSMRDWYTQFVVMAIRRQADRPHQDVHSLHSVLEEMVDNASLLTRSKIESLLASDPEMRRHLAARPDFVDYFADWKFVDGGELGEPHIDVAVVRADIAALDAVSRDVRAYANKRIAHSAKRGQGREDQMTYAGIDEAIDRFHDIAIKYIALLTGAAYTDLTPTDQFDWYSIFRFAWRPRGLRRADKEEDAADL
jgi:hypothetical protein